MKMLATIAVVLLLLFMLAFDDHHPDGY